MSDLLVGWVLGHSEAEGVLRMVLVVLAKAARETTPAGAGTIRLGRITRQAKLGNEEQAAKALELLSQAGHIKYTLFGVRVNYIVEHDSEWLQIHIQRRNGETAAADVMGARGATRESATDGSADRVPIPR